MNKVFNILRNIVFIAVLLPAIATSGLSSIEADGVVFNNLTSTTLDSAILDSATLIAMDNASDKQNLNSALSKDSNTHEAFTTLIDKEVMNPFNLTSIIDITPLRIYKTSPNANEYLAILKLSVNKGSYNKAVSYMNAYLEANKIATKGKNISTIRSINASHIIQPGSILSFNSYKYDNRKKEYDIELAVANEFTDQYNILLYLTTNNHKMHYLNMVINRLNIQQERFDVTLDLVNHDGVALDRYTMNIFDTDNLSLLFNTKNDNIYTLSLDEKNKILNLIMPKGEEGDVKIIAPYMTILLDGIKYNVDQLTLAVKISSDAQDVSDIIVRR